MAEAYKQFCPIALTADTLCTRWTMLIVRELLAGSTRFNEFRRALTRISPTLLAQRLRELEEAGIVERVRVAGPGDLFEYRLTERGRDLEGIVQAFGEWGQRWVEARAMLQNLDVHYLMWNMHKRIDAVHMGKQPCVVNFLYSDLPAAKRAWWLVARPEAPVDLCWNDPGLDVDLYVATDLKTMTSIWMGVSKLAREIEAGAVMLTGDARVAAAMPSWLGLSIVAGVAKRAG